MNKGSGFSGTSGVHFHMINSRLTDPKILEMRFPVLLGDFPIRKDSGSKGKYPACDGTRRTIRFLENMECAILPSRRTIPPCWIDGSGYSEVGQTEIQRKDGADLERGKVSVQSPLVSNQLVTLFKSELSTDYSVCTIQVYMKAAGPIPPLSLIRANDTICI